MVQTSADSAEHGDDGGADDGPPAAPGRPEAVLVADRPLAGTAVVRVDGDVDLLTSPTLRARVDAELATRPELLVLDLTRVDFLASSGLALLVDARTAAERDGVRLQLAATGRAVLRPLTATGLAHLFDVVDTPPAG